MGGTFLGDSGGDARTDGLGGALHDCGCSGFGFGSIGASPWILRYGISGDVYGAVQFFLALPCGRVWDMDV